MISPYWGAGFFGFFQVLGMRLVQFCSGQLGMADLVPDEIQILILSLLAVAAGLIGPFLVLRRMSLLANSLSHTILPGILFAYWIVGSLELNTLLLGAAAAALVTAGLTQFFHRYFRLQEDASIGLVFTSLFAFGIFGVSVWFRDLHLGLETVTGNADALQLSDLRIAALLAAMNGAALLFFYYPLRAMSFDRGTGWPYFLLLFLTAATAVGSMRAVGILLVLSLLVGPYLTVRLFSNRLGRILIWTPLVGIAAALLGVALSRSVLSVWDLPLSTGGIVALLIACFYGVGFICFRKYRN